MMMGPGNLEEADFEETGIMGPGNLDEAGTVDFD